MRPLYLVVDNSDLEAAKTEQDIKHIDRTADVLHARTIESAMEVLEVYRTVPSLIFAESLLPDGDGLDLLRDLRNTRWLESVPVAMLSRPVTDRMVVTCYRLGACAFLTKPVHSHELRAVIRDFAQLPVAMASGKFLARTGGAGPRRWVA